MQGFNFYWIFHDALNKKITSPKIILRRKGASVIEKINIT